MEDYVDLHARVHVCECFRMGLSLTSLLLHGHMSVIVCVFYFVSRRFASTTTSVPVFAFRL